MAALVTLDRLKALYEYDPATGVFRARVSRPRYRAGAVVGSLTRMGYLRTRIDGREYLLHRLAWFYMTGEWPDLIDHRDRNKQNNRFKNLREASVSQNKVNSSTTNPTGFTGVRFRPGLNKPFRAEIEVGGHSRHLGYFATADEAGAAYRREAIRAHGEFAMELN